jgi:hypothetical protein
MYPAGLETHRTADLEVGATCLRTGSKAAEPLSLPSNHPRAYTHGQWIR